MKIKKIAGLIVILLIASLVLTACVNNSDAPLDGALNGEWNDAAVARLTIRGSRWEVVLTYTVYPFGHPQEDWQGFALPPVGTRVDGDGSGFMWQAIRWGVIGTVETGGWIDQIPYTGADWFRDGMPQAWRQEGNPSVNVVIIESREAPDLVGGMFVRAEFTFGGTFSVTDNRIEFLHDDGSVAWSGRFSHRADSLSLGDFSETRLGRSR